jgi:glutamine synthetase
LISGLTPVEYVLRTAEERQIRFVRLWFVDVLGHLKSSSIPISELEQTLVDGLGLDGSSLESGARLVEVDVIARPDPTTFVELPWRPDAEVASMFCSIELPDGSPFAGDCRDSLRRQLRRIADRGYTLQVGPEIEFFLFAAPFGTGAPVPLDEGSYFDSTSVDDGSDFRRQTIDYLEAMGIPVKESHHEVGPSQHEIDLKHSDAMSTADAITIFRLAVKEAAARQGAFATFMPKPLDGVPGSGLHLHLSLLDVDTGRGAFHDDDPERPLSPVGNAFLAGILRHAPELTAVTNQWVNSYKRLLSGFEAPRAVTWTRRPQSALVRVPSNRPGRESSARIELRSPDPACNPYLVLTLIGAAGLRGIEGGYELPPELDECAGSLPSDLGEALALFERSQLAREALGDELHGWFLRNKLQEWREHREQVTADERVRFSRLF